MVHIDSRIYDAMDGDGDGYMKQTEWEEFIFFLFSIYIVMAIWGIQ